MINHIQKQIKNTQIFFIVSFFILSLHKEFYCITIMIFPSLSAFQIFAHSFFMIYNQQTCLIINPFSFFFLRGSVHSAFLSPAPSLSLSIYIYVCVCVRACIIQKVVSLTQILDLSLTFHFALISVQMKSIQKSE